MDRLTDEEVERELGTMKGWSFRDQYIVKAFRFQTYRAEIAFVNQIANLAEERNHHPDMMVNYLTLGIRLMSHDARGLTMADFECARAIDALPT